MALEETVDGRARYRRILDHTANFRYFMDHWPELCREHHSQDSRL